MEQKKWRAVPREELEVSGQRVIEDENGYEVAYVGFDEDAEFIELACNAHAGLVEALKYARNWLASQDGNAMLIAMNNPEVMRAFTKIDQALFKAGIK